MLRTMFMVLSHSLFVSLFFLHCRRSVYASIYAIFGVHTFYQRVKNETTFRFFVPPASFSFSVIHGSLCDFFSKCKFIEDQWRTSNPLFYATLF